MHLGYHELRKLLSQFADERMAARQNQNQNQNQQGPPGGPGPNGNGSYGGTYGAPSGPGSNSNNYGPRAPPSAPSGPSSKMAPPQTPVHYQVPPADEMPTVGHGDKVKREAGELVEDVKVEKEERRHRSEDKYER